MPKFQDMEIETQCGKGIELLSRFVKWYLEYWWEITTAEIAVLAILWALVIAKNCSEVAR